MPSTFKPKPTFDNLQLDTETPEYTPHRAHDSSHEKAGKTSWLRKPAIFGGSSKRDKTPHRTERGGPQSAGRAESPPRKVDTSSAHHHPGAAPSKVSKGNDLAYRSLAAKDQHVGHVSNSHSTHHSAREQHEAHGGDSRSMHTVAQDVKSSKHDTSKLESEVEELKKEVKGLQDAFNKLQKEHGELRGELRGARLPAQSCGALPIDALGKKSSSDFGLGTSPRFPQSSTVHKLDSTHMPRPPAEVDILQSLLTSCGFSRPLALEAHPSPAQVDARAPSPPQATVPLTKEQQDQWDAEASRQRAFYEGNRFADTANSYKPFSLTDHTLESGTSKTSPSHHANNSQMGGSSSSTTPGTAAQRQASPHDREGPMNMEGRGGKRKSGAGTSGETNGIGSPLSSPTSKVRIEAGNQGGTTTTAWQGLSSKSENPMASKKPFSIGTLSLPQRGEDLPSNFGAADNAVPRFGLESDRKEKNNHSSLHYGSNDINSSSLSRVHHWKSPQAGEPLELPFPDIPMQDDDGGSHIPDSTFPFPGVSHHHAGSQSEHVAGDAALQAGSSLLGQSEHVDVDKFSHPPPGTIQLHALSSHSDHDSMSAQNNLSLEGHSMRPNPSEIRDPSETKDHLTKHVSP